MATDAMPISNHRMSGEGLRMFPQYRLFHSRQPPVDRAPTTRDPQHPLPSQGAEQRLVNASGVLPAVEQRGGCPLVLSLLAECAGKPRETPVPHPQAEIGPFDDRRANARRIGTAHDWDDLHGLRFGGAVLGTPVDLDELREGVSAATTV
jgi:hypothetical protein